MEWCTINNASTRGDIIRKMIGIDGGLDLDSESLDPNNIINLEALGRAENNSRITILNLSKWSRGVPRLSYVPFSCLEFF